MQPVKKSQPPNAAREIFARAVGEITRETVSAAICIVLDAKKVAPNRAEFEPLTSLFPL